MRKQLITGAVIFFVCLFGIFWTSHQDGWWVIPAMITFGIGICVGLATIFDPVS